MKVAPPTTERVDAGRRQELQRKFGFEPERIDAIARQVLGRK